jgi:Divergent InlB B-repeat domain/MAM domain, meprin/A5/mu
MSSSVQRYLVLLFSLIFFSSLTQGSVLLNTDFEGSSSLPAGWTQTQISGSATWKVQTGGNTGGNNPSTAHGGTYNATLFIANTGDNKTRLISPIIWTEVYTGLSLTFWHTQAVWPNDQDQLKVFYSIDAGTNWTEMAYYTNSVTAWTKRTIALPTASASSRIAFEGNAKYGYGVCIDDIQVTGTATVALPVVSVSATDASASETGPDAGTWTVTRTGSTNGAVTVNFGLSGTAVTGSDYSMSHTGSVTLAAGVTSVVVTLTPLNDTVYDELTETAVLTLASGAGYELGTTAATITIADNDVSDLQVLIIGSTHDSSEQFGGDSKVFSPANVGTNLYNILAGCGLGHVNVSVVDRYATASTVMGTTCYAHNLASWFHWPFPKGAESNRWANLRGEAGIDWDYVILIPDSYTVEYMPGLFALGAAKISEEVAKGNAETILFMPWPASTSSRTIAHYKEVVYRAGRSGQLKVAPGGLAWQAIKGSALTNPNPNADGAFIAAASIYSAIYQQSAKTSTFVYNDTWADTINTTEANNRNAQQYTGNFSFQNPFLGRTDTNRTIQFSSRGTSTESYFRGSVISAIDRCYVSQANHCPWNRSTNDWANNGGDTPWIKFPTTWPAPIAFNDGRDGATAEWYKSYLVDPTHWNFAYGYIYQANTWSQPVADANDHFVSCMFSQDFELAKRMMTQGNSARNIPVRTLWASIHQQFPNLNPLMDGSGPHLNAFEHEAVGTYMYTLYSGRCPLDPKPVNIDTNWMARRIGYETAWRVGRCQIRAPGFKVMPSSATALTVTPTTKGTLTVRFILPPRSNVTVQVTMDNPKAAIFNPHALLFTTNNYDTAQTVTFAGLAGVTNSDPFSLSFDTTSSDETYNDLSDSWAYTTTRSSTQATVISENGTNNVVGSENTPLTIFPDITGITSGNTTFAGPLNGAVVVSGTNLVYTPNLGYVGSDSFAYAVNSGGTVTRGYVTITINPSSMKSVSVISAQGGASPGTVITNSGTALSFAIINSPVISGGTTKYVANGGTVSGNSYTQVNTTNITLTVTNSCTLTWAWSTNYWLALTTTEGGSVNVTNGWQVAGTSVVITATASNIWVFTGWTGATNGCAIVGNVITAPMTSTRSITANFAQPLPTVNNSAGAVSQSTTSVTLRAVLTQGITANGYFCWGTQDAGTASIGDWQNVVSVGSVTEDVAFSTFLTGLSTNVTYWYRCFATNANGSAWTATAKPFSGSPSGGQWLPTDMTCAAWYDASTASINAGTVTVTNAGIQGGTISGPAALAANGIGTLQAVNFNATTRYLTGDYTNTTATLTAFYVGKSLNTSQTAYAGMMSVWQNGQASDFNNLGSSVLLNQNNATVNSVQTYRNAALSSTTATLTNGFLAVTVFTGSTNTLYLNGTPATGVASSANFNTGKIVIGARWQTSVFNNFWNGNFGEAIICNTNLNVSDRQKIEGYLAHKWGLVAQLPTNHPYATQSPGGTGDIINNRAPTGITETNATFNATLSATGTVYTVYAYWGTSNGGTNSGSWTSSTLIGSWSNVVTDVSYPVSGLLPGQTYYYTFCASNASGRAWATPSWTFSTPGISGVLPTYTITATNGSDGSISPSGAITVGHGSNQTFTVTADTGFHIDDVLVDDISIGAVDNYTFSNVTADHTITANFAINQYTVRFEPGAHGTRTGGAELTQIVNYGEPAFAPVITAEIGYTFVSWDTSFSSVTNDLTINAVYTQLPTYTITASSGAGGSLTPSGAVMVIEGSNQTFDVTADIGYHISDVLADSVSVGATASYTFTNVLAAHTISASFAINQYTVQFVVGTHGARTGGGALTQTVNHGASATSPVITPHAGYAFDGWDSSFSSITSNLTLAALYSQLPTYAITATSGTGGSLSPSGTVMVMHGSNQTFAVTANTGYSISNVVVDSVSVGAITNYTFTNVIAPHTISASFAIIITHAIPFFEPFEARNEGDLNGQYDWIAEGTVVQTNTTFNNSTKAAQISGDGGYMRYAFSDGKTKAWTDMRVRVVQSPEKPTPETNTTVGVYVSTNSMVMAFNGTNVVSTGLAAPQGSWLRLTMFSDYAAKTYILYVNDQRAGKYAFYNNTSVTNLTGLKISGQATFVDDVGITPKQPGMKGMPSLILMK